MVIRVVAIVPVFLAFVNCKPISLEKSEKCNYCIDLIHTGLSPYEVLWTLKEEIGSELPSEVSETEMLIKTEDIKMAEGAFLEYCRLKCQKFFEKEKIGETNKSLHFIPAEEEEKFTKLAQTEFEKFEKKPDKDVLETPLEAPKINLNNTDEKPYQNVLFGTEVVNLHRKSRSLQNLENPGNGSSSIPEVTPRQLPLANETSEASEPKQTVQVNATESSEPLTESSKNDPQMTPIVQVTEASTTAKPKTTPSHTLGNDESNYDNLFSITDFLGKDGEEQKDKTEEYGKILNDLINPAYSEEAINSISKSILQTTDFVNCILDLILNEMGAALGIQPGVPVREQCDKKLPPSMAEQDIASIFAPLIKYIQSQKITTNSIPPVQKNPFEGPKYGFPNHFAGVPPEYRPPGFPPPGVETYYGGYHDGSYPYYPFGTSRSLSKAPFYSSAHGTAPSGFVEEFKNFIPKKFNSWYPDSSLEKEK